MTSSKFGHNVIWRDKDKGTYLFHRTYYNLKPSGNDMKPHETTRKPHETSIISVDHIVKLVETIWIFWFQSLEIEKTKKIGNGALSIILRIKLKLIQCPDFPFYIFLGFLLKACCWTGTKLPNHVSSIRHIVVVGETNHCTFVFDLADFMDFVL